MSINVNVITYYQDQSTTYLINAQADTAFTFLNCSRLYHYLFYLKTEFIYKLCLKTQYINL